MGHRNKTKIVMLPVVAQPGSYPGARTRVGGRSLPHGPGLAEAKGGHGLNLL